MASKKKIHNKAEKQVITDKVVAIDWKSQPNTVVVIALKHKHLVEGKEYSIPKEQAKLLTSINAVKLK